MVKSLVAAVGAGVAVVIAAVAIVIGIVLLSVAAVSVYQHFEGGLMSQHQQNQRHSLDFVQAQNSRAEELIGEYEVATDTQHASALSTQICSAANNLDASERRPDVQNFYLANCIGVR